MVILEAHAQKASPFFLHAPVGSDIALFMKDPEDVLFDTRSGNIHSLVSRAHSVAQAVQQVGDGIAGHDAAFHVRPSPTRMPSTRRADIRPRRSAESKCDKAQTCARRSSRGRKSGTDAPCAS